MLSILTTPSLCSQKSLSKEAAVEDDSPQSHSGTHSEGEKFDSLKKKTKDKDKKGVSK